MSDTTPKPLAIVGLGALFPKADSLEAYWANCKGAIDCITEVPSTHWDPKDHFDPDPKTPDKVYAKRGGFLDAVDFDPLEYGISPQSIEATDTSQLLGLVAAKRALEDAGYGADSGVDRDRISCILGVTGTLELVIPLGARLGHPLWRRALAQAGVDDETAEDVVVGVVERSRDGSRSLTISGIEVLGPPGCPALEPGTAARAVGSYEGGRLVARKLRAATPAAIQVDVILAPIEAVDAATGTLRVAGIAVDADTRTKVDRPEAR